LDLSIHDRLSSYLPGSDKRSLPRRQLRIRIRDVDPSQVHVDSHAPPALEVGDRTISLDGCMPTTLDVRCETKLPHRDMPREPLAVRDVGCALLEQGHAASAT